jgi:hypothetical protein
MQTIFKIDQILQSMTKIERVLMCLMLNMDKMSNMEDIKMRTSLKRATVMELMIPALYFATK